MRRVAILAFGLWIAATSAQAQISVVQGAPPVTDETKAALGKVRADGSRELYQLAEAGRIDAQTYAGVLLAFRSDAEPDKRKGCGYLEAASATRSDAMHFLGEAYQYGRCGGRIDLEKAITTFHKAGDMGLGKSRCAEGNVLLELGRDQARAVRLCTEGAEMGDADAQTDVGNFYLSGRFVKKDAVAARGWYEKAVAQGHRNAAYTLGQIYWYGDGVAKDTAKAAQLWRLAYDQGRPDAAVLLGDEAMERATRKLDANQLAAVGAGEAALDQAILSEALDWYEKALAAAPPQSRGQIEDRIKKAKLFKRPDSKGGA
ncbi:tetratricopeptide repeat protein [Phenylobacterium sp.]|uniref:tetratricopeptide repeat protein n=1 Tax=Phenylobacterium sp. TaxID=1871053 RepID=UPI0025F45937|nr:tetratricopeptide repeat protein [Phenylobacterium sp.]